jgi:adenylate kinase
MKVILIGVQGSGKTTQATKLAKRLNLPMYTMSQLLKDAIAEDDVYVTTEFTLDDMRKGILAPTHITKYLYDKIKDESFVFEGYMRTEEQAKSLSTNSDVIVIELLLSKDEATKRMLSRQRDDDTIESIDRRLESFYSNINNIRNYIKVHQVDAIGDIEQVNNNMLYIIKAQGV